MSEFTLRFHSVRNAYESLVRKPNYPSRTSNGIYQRWRYPVLTRDHAPITWRYDLDEKTNPYFMERIGINATLNPGAIFWKDKYILVARVEGNDRKSFFAVAESDNGVDNFRFWDKPIVMPETECPDTNVYDMRLTQHQDGYIYGLFCTERKDESRLDDVSAAVAQCGIARTKDLINWDRLQDLKTYSGQQRNVVLHPEFVNGQYALYTRPQDGFISVGSGGGVGFGLASDITQAEVKEESIVDGKVYHTIKEVKNGQGPTPLKTDSGWLHLAHGVRNTAAGLRYVLYMFMTDLKQPWRVIHRPGGHFIAPEGCERVGDVSNVVFSNGWLVNENNEVFIYYASSDTRIHVATTSLDKLIDYVTNTPEDEGRSFTSVANICRLVGNNARVMTSWEK